MEEGKAPLVVPVQSCFLLILMTSEDLQHFMLLINHQLYVTFLVVCSIFQLFPSLSGKEVKTKGRQTNR